MQKLLTIDEINFKRSKYVEKCTVFMVWKTEWLKYQIFIYSHSVYFNIILIKISVTSL